MDAVNVSGCAARRSAIRQHSRRDGWLVAALIALPGAIVGLIASLSLSRPADEELAARFFAHEADFQRLSVLLHSDGRRFLGAREPLNLAALVARGADRNSYRLLLTEIGAIDLQYFPKSGRILLPIAASDASFAGVSKFYLYMGDAQSTPLVSAQQYSLRAPGIAATRGDFQIGGGWYVHREGGAVVSGAY